MLENAINIIKTELKNMPNSPGVYRMIDKAGKILYIGKAKDLAKRITNYTQINRLCERMKLAISQTVKLEIITAATEAQALVLEANLIKSLRPKYNILLKDDKSMPYILLRQDHAYSQILKFRGNRNLKGQYFGPFASPKIVDDTIEFLEKNFLLRNCSDSFFALRKTPCMQYQIKRCSAPCVGKIQEIDYQKNVDQALSFLKGKSLVLQQELSELMQQASAKQEYEKAAKYRDQLRSLNYIQNRNDNSFNLEDADVIALVKDGDLACVQIFLFRNGQNYGNRCFFFEQVMDDEEEKILSLFLAQFYQHTEAPKDIILPFAPEDMLALSEAFGLKIIIPKSGNNYKALNFAIDNAKSAMNRKYEEKNQRKILLQEVQKLFAIDNPIKRIEVYDNSHISGSHAVGAMIVAGEDGFNKKQYRKYNIKTTDVGDDYAMTREVLTRRLSKPDNLPDILLIDGGEGHLNIANEVLNGLGLDIKLICISKGVERNSGREIFHQKNVPSFTLDKNLPVMKYLQILRDEAHRFAITSHRQKRSQAIGFGSLNQIVGVGAKRRKTLINHFASIKEIQEASVEQLIKVEGINRKIAEAIYSYYH